MTLGLGEQRPIRELYECHCASATSVTSAQARPLARHLVTKWRQDLPPTYIIWVHFLVVPDMFLETVVKKVLKTVVTIRKSEKSIYSFKGP